LNDGGELIWQIAAGHWLGSVWWFGAGQRGTAWLGDGGGGQWAGLCLAGSFGSMATRHRGGRGLCGGECTELKRHGWARLLQGGRGHRFTAEKTPTAASRLGGVGVFP
jgi:hypothetical protein